MNLIYSPDDVVGQIKTVIATDLVPDVGPIPLGPFSVIMADPPWSYSLRETDATHRGRCEYPGMTIDDICALPVQDSAAPESYLLLWVTNAHLIDGLGPKLRKHGVLNLSQFTHGTKRRTMAINSASGSGIMGAIVLSMF